MPSLLDVLAMGLHPLEAASNAALCLSLHTANIHLGHGFATCIIDCQVAHAHTAPLTCGIRCPAHRRICLLRTREGILICSGGSCGTDARTDAGGRDATPKIEWHVALAYTAPHTFAIRCPAHRRICLLRAREGILICSGGPDLATCQVVLDGICIVKSMILDCNRVASSSKNGCISVELADNTKFMRTTERNIFATTAEN